MKTQSKKTESPKQKISAPRIAIVKASWHSDTEMFSIYRMTRRIGMEKQSTKTESAKKKIEAQQIAVIKAPLQR